MKYILDCFLESLLNDLELYVILNDINEDESKELKKIIDLFIKHLSKYYYNNSDNQLILSFDFHLHEYYIEQYNLKTNAIYIYKELETFKYLKIYKGKWSDIDYVQYYLNKNCCDKKFLKGLSWFIINNYYNYIQKNITNFYKIKDYKEYPYNMTLNIFDLNLWIKDQGDIDNLLKKYKEYIKLKNIELEQLNLKYYKKRML